MNCMTLAYRGMKINNDANNSAVLFPNMCKYYSACSLNIALDIAMEIVRLMLGQSRSLSHSNFQV